MSYWIIFPVIAVAVGLIKYKNYGQGSRPAGRIATEEETIRDKKMIHSARYRDREMSSCETDIVVELTSLRIDNPESIELRDIFNAIVKIYWQLKNDYKYDVLHNDQLRSRLENIISTYCRKLWHQTDRTDFSDERTRWVYMYRYMLRHVHLVFYACELTANDEIGRVFPGNKARNVCMIGGGPGTDILGLAMFLLEQKNPHSLCPIFAEIDVLDKCTAWADSWESLHRHLPEKYRRGIPEVRYHAFDYLDNRLPWTCREVVRKADIVTMIKSMSPAAAWLNTKKRVFANRIPPYDIPLYNRSAPILEWHSVYDIMLHMRYGAYLFYIDNRTGPQRDILMGAARELKFEVIFERVLYGVSLPTDVFSPDARKVIVAMGEYKPCSCTGTNEVIILYKTELKLDVLRTDDN